MDVTPWMQILPLTDDNIIIVDGDTPLDEAVCDYGICLETPAVYVDDDGWYCEKHFPERIMVIVRLRRNHER